MEELPRNSTAHIVPTYKFHLGKTHYCHNGIHYESKIADNDLIIDEKHQLYFYTSTEWVHFLQKTYPTSHQIYLPLTMHEMFKIMEEQEKLEQEIHQKISKITSDQEKLKQKNKNIESPRKRHVYTYIDKIVLKIHE